MTLALIMTNCPDSVAPERRSISGGVLTIGRGTDNDWILPDPGRHLSKRHCQIDFHGGRWELSDLSANGTFVNHAAAPIGRGAARVLRDGDCIGLGDYELMVCLAADANASGRAELAVAAGPLSTGPDAPAAPRARADASERAGQASGQAPAALRSLPTMDAATITPMAAFLTGAGLPDAQVSDPLQLLAAAGATLRASLGGIRRALGVVASVKSEFRIARTMFKPNGNNPLHFSAGDDDALAACIGLGTWNTMRGAAAVTEALDDIRRHEHAMVVAMQAGVRALLTRFEPAAIARQAGTGGIGLLSQSRNSRSWAMFETVYSTVSQELSDDFDSVFGKAFARAYEDAMQEQADGELP